MQFRIRNLLFVTFVVALCSGMMTLSLPAGCVASLPMIVAVARTLRRGSQPSQSGKPTSLWLTFVESLALLAALVVVSLCWIVVTAWSIAFFLLRLTGRIGRRAALLSKDVMLRVHVAEGVAVLSRLSARCLVAMVAGTRTVTEMVARGLNRTNRTLYTHWSL